MLVKFFGGALVIGSKFSLGREGPTVHIGASLADEVAKRAKVPRHLRDHLVACGAGAGLAAAFNAPLAGFLFVIEELRREVSSVTLGMALLGTVLADAVVQLTLGARPMLRVSDISLPSIESVPVILIIAVAATFGGLLCNNALIAGVTKVPAGCPLWARGVVVGGLVGVCMYVVPALVLDEQGVFDLISQGPSLSEMSLLMLGALFIAKLLLTAACYATGVPGGIFAPMLVQGAFLGFFTAKVLALTPLLIPSLEVCALVGMTAFFAAAVRAPFTGVVLLAEMTNGFSLLLPLMVAALVGYFVAELLGTQPIYERLLASAKTDATRHREGL
jgi:CIC family chloride channel protein